MVGQCKQRTYRAQLILGLLLVGWLLYLSSSQEWDRLNKDEIVSDNNNMVVEDSHPLAYTEEDVLYVTQALYFEDALGPVECQLMIAHVIQNRMYSEKFPNTAKEVVWQHRQFSFTQDGKHERMELKNTRKRLEQLARVVLGGYSVDNTGGSMFYYNPSLVTPVWRKDYQPYVACGQHLFLISKDKGEWS